MSLSRRTLVKGAAWAAPVVAASAAIPAYAASSSTGGSLPSDQATTPATCPQGSWSTGAKIIFTDPDYSNTNYLNKINYNTTPYGEAEMQHWFNGNTKKLYWRFHLGFPQGAEAGATITLPFDESWTNPSVPTQSGLSAFMRFDPKNGSLYSTDLPVASIAQGTTTYVLTFSQTIPAGAAGIVEFNADPVGGEEAVRSGTPYEAWATVNFTPATCD